MNFMALLLNRIILLCDALVSVVIRDVKKVFFFDLVARASCE